MLEVQQLSLIFSGQTLFNDSSFTLYTGQKYGLVGKNGAGKTSLFNVITGKQKPDGGKVIYNKSTIITAIEQECEDLNQISIDYVISGYPVLGEIWCELKRLESESDSHKDYEKIADLYAQIDELQGFDIQARAATILDGLGFSEEDLTKNLSQFSGGWQMRLNLARCLLVPSEILLLDEPTNHLDMDAILWLEKWLRQYQGSLLLISHDRAFLDKIINYVLAIENQQFKTYKGNYSQYEQQKHLQDQGQAKAYEKITKERDHIMQFVNKFKAKASKAKQAQSRLKMLDKLPIIEKVTQEHGYSFNFFPSQKVSNPAIKISHLSFGYTASKKILDNVNLSFEPNERIGLLGFNGAGKSTLMKVLAGKLACHTNERLAATHLNIGYFAQHQLEALDLEESPLWHLQKIASGVGPTALRTYLGRFAFTEDKVLEPVRYFSGGEKARLALALLMWKKPNVLLLDEPTNHLDIYIRQALCLALQSYDGLLILVSHDRYLLEATVNQFYLVHDTKVEPFDGTLADYDQWSTETKRQQSRKSVKPKEVKAPLKKESCQKTLLQIERKIDKLNLSIAKVDEKMTLVEPTDHEKLIKLQQERVAFETKLADLEEQWLNLSS